MWVHHCEIVRKVRQERGMPMGGDIMSEYDSPLIRVENRNFFAVLREVVSRMGRHYCY